MNEQAAWDIYFAQLCSWRLHPGYLRDETIPPTYKQIAYMADEMLKQRALRWAQPQGPPLAA